jgi:hypothetical protein
MIQNKNNNRIPINFLTVLVGINIGIIFRADFHVFVADFLLVLRRFHWLSFSLMVLGMIQLDSFTWAY